MLQKRVVGLDSIRAVCALWVVFGHFGGPPVLAGIDTDNRFCKILNGIYNNFWNGPAAVIVFFVISGFCIHYPQVGKNGINSIASFYSRRFIRIIVPMGVAVLVSKFAGSDLSNLNESVLWSLICELIYYLIYPLILFLARTPKRWMPLFCVSFVAALLVVASNPTAKNYPSFGLGLNWILGLPCWLLGCLLAEKHFEKEKLVGVSFSLIVFWRLLVFGVTVVLSVLRFHSPLGYPWTLNFFAILAAFWLGFEIRYFSAVQPSKWLEYLGLMSFSLYLIHIPAHSLQSFLSLPNLGYLLNWLVSLMFIMISCVLFYLLVENPSHLLAKAVGKRVGGKLSGGK